MPIRKKLTEDQILLIENSLPNEKEKIRLLLSYYCSLKLEEVLRIKIADFLWEEWKKDITKIGKCCLDWKKEGEQIIIIPVGLMKRIARYIRSNDYRNLNDPAFLTIEDNEKFDVNNQIRIWHRRLRETGIRIGITKLNNYGSPVEHQIVTPERVKKSYN